MADEKKAAPKKKEVTKDAPGAGKPTGPATNLAVVMIQEGQAASVRYLNGQAIIKSTGPDADIVVNVDTGKGVIVAVSQ